MSKYLIYLIPILFLGCTEKNKNKLDFIEYDNSSAYECEKLTQRLATFDEIRNYKNNFKESECLNLELSKEQLYKFNEKEIRSVKNNKICLRITDFKLILISEINYDKLEQKHYCIKNEN